VQNVAVAIERGGVVAGTITSAGEPISGVQAGTCRSDPRPTPLTAGWILKSVILDGREVIDENVWFEPGRHSMKMCESS
jgi:hypothetical protein